MKSKSLNIVFMGTPDFAVKSLEILVNSKHNLVAVVTSLLLEYWKEPSMLTAPPILTIVLLLSPPSLLLIL